jgi:hypothetical protein
MSFKPKAKVPMARTNRTAPAKSKDFRAGMAVGFGFGRYRHAIASASSPRGRLIRKTAFHPNDAATAPPSAGPEAVPTAAMLPTNPIAAPTLRAGAMSLTAARLTAISTAAPIP